jgi:hypothetical protein
LKNILASFAAVEGVAEGYDRRNFLKGMSVAGAGIVGVGLLAGCGGSNVSPSGSSSSGSAANDQAILGAAKIAEALAVTMYTLLIASPVFTALPSTDQAYFTAAQSEEMYHYNILKSATGGTDAGLTYYFPTGMFTTAGTGVQTTFNTIVTLEEAFIAAYLLGVSEFSTSGLRVLAAQIMGVEAEHRAEARNAAGDSGLASTTGLSGASAIVNPVNNVVFEQTYGVNQLSVVVTALKPFFDGPTASSAGHTVVGTFNPAFVPSSNGLIGITPS